MNSFRTSRDGLAWIERREGRRLVGYLDSKGLLTIGVGHLVKPGEPYALGERIGEEECARLLAIDVGEAERCINANVARPLTQGQFDALASLVFNIGVGAFTKSTVLRKLNAGDARGAADAFMMWTKPKELVGRRRAERQQFLAATPAGPIMQKVEQGEEVTAQDLRAQGSRTMKAADDVHGASVVLGPAVATAGGLASQMQDVSAQLQSAADGVSTLSGAFGWAEGHWRLLVVILASAVAAAALWAIWRGASQVKAARVDDANLGLHLGR